MTVRLACEGPTCNAGHSARVREAAVRHEMADVNQEVRDEADRHARQTVSRALAVTPHARSGVTRLGGVAFALYACCRCSHERVYGNSATFQP